MDIFLCNMIFLQLNKSYFLFDVFAQLHTFPRSCVSRSHALFIPYLRELQSKFNSALHNILDSECHVGITHLLVFRTAHDGFEG